MCIHNIKYIGCFFDPGTLGKNLETIARTPLSQTILAPHVTFRYAPSVVPWDMLGREVTVVVTGYGNDGSNEALKVAFLELPPGLEALADEIEVPHITLSISDEGKAVNSRSLNYHPTARFCLTGVFGAMDQGENLHL